MSTPPPKRRVTLAASYRDLSERQIRAKLEGPMTDAERVTAQAELLRRGIGSDHQDTTPASGFAPTSTLDLSGQKPDTDAPAGTERPAAPVEATPRRTGRAIALIVALAVLGIAAIAWLLQGR